MAIKYAILGYLSWRPMTGYELKKLFSDSVLFHWSGNSNQIYRTLVKLHQDDLVSTEVKQQEKYPAKKIYTITEKGLVEINNWLLSSPEPPQFRDSFLIQLAWADLLNSDELEDLLSQYEHEVKMQMLMCKEEKRRQPAMPGRTKRESFLWDMLYENRISAFESQLNWIAKTRAGLKVNI